MHFYRVNQLMQISFTRLIKCKFLEKEGEKLIKEIR